MPSGTIASVFPVSALTSRWRTFLLGLLACALTALGAVPAPAGAKLVRGTCPQGQVPVVRAHKLTVKRGKLRCARGEKLKAARVLRPSAAPVSQFAATADGIRDALRVDPTAFGRVSRKVGARRTNALIALGLDSWRSHVGARLRADDGLHLDQTFTADKGATARVKLDAAGTGDPATQGVKATGSIEVDVPAKTLDALGADKLTGGGKGAKVTLAIDFTDALTACPDANGIVNGKVSGKARLQLSLDGGTTQFASAAVSVTYRLTVGGDARWKTIDNVDAQTELQLGGSGQSTQTWRGRRFGSGFGATGIFNPPAGQSTSDAFTAQFANIDQNRGGIFGPHSSVHFDTGPEAWDIRSIDNLKGLAVTVVASNYALLAATEYIRGVAAPRNQKHWYDDEACLRLEAAPAASRLGPGQTTKVTARNAKAADGTPVPATLAATGVASLVPASASMAAGGSFAFTLTAPNTTPTRSSWNVVALSRAGKKTVSGTLGDDVSYTVVLDDLETGDFATHRVTAKLTGRVATTPVAGAPTKSSASAPVTWTPLTAESKVPECSLIDPVTAGVWTAEITTDNPDTITVTIDFSADTHLNYTFYCVYPDSPPSSTPGFTGAMPVGFAPRTFTLPRSGGTQTIAGAVQDQGDGFTSGGTVTVTPGATAG